MIKFIIGTDTGVGKTYYGRKLIKEGHKVIKPIETGKADFEDIHKSDSYQYSHLQDLPIDQINLYFFDTPASPHLAAELDHEEVDLDKVKHFIKDAGSSYVELAGGLMVPLTRNYTQLDLIKSFPDSQVDLVVSNKLGCINHTLLTLELLRSHHIKIGKIYINNMENESIISRDNEKTILDYIKTSAD
ncbi:dethiobiotin synthase [Acidaminobacter sp. JC074]|uniref:dethiobiotin synthase n=1 Tax=Acidaminobacter sp. JC074 TaxID=2530199 RepID=UPI001F107317|nr:dethiobiotin synthase [Acidaminobacter sp. JC074]MCH4888866.1 dethiobiotin synthase [Acidaminobacter sp. JC074]